MEVALREAHHCTALRRIGNPLVARSVALDAQIARLTRLASAHRDEQASLRARVRNTTAAIPANRELVEKLDSDAGSEVTLDKVLLVGGAAGSQIGAPYVSGASVTATVDAQGKGEKIVVFKYKPKKRYRRRIGHRQQLTELTITGINA